jgi:hypothetical protein
VPLLLAYADVGHGRILLQWFDYSAPNPIHLAITFRSDADNGTFLSFDKVVERLCRHAQKIASTAPEAPQPEIAVVDVSGCAKSKTATRQHRSTARTRGRAAA